jgi:hypothetical protein
MNAILGLETGSATRSNRSCSVRCSICADDSLRSGTNGKLHACAMMHWRLCGIAKIFVVGALERSEQIGNICPLFGWERPSRCMRASWLDIHPNSGVEGDPHAVIVSVCGSEARAEASCSAP